MNALAPAVSRRTVSSPAALLLVTAFLAVVGPTAGAQDDETELAKKTQNPVSDLISVPLQSNFNFGVGPGDDLQYVLNVQPVVPFSLNETWNLINRPIVPVVYQPGLGPGIGNAWGIGDIQYQGFFSPKEPTASGWIWGAGPVIQFPTATDQSFASDKWAAGPGAVVIRSEGPLVYGLLANNIFSFAGDDDAADINAALFQVIFNYNFDDGWYFTSSPIITANWEADRDDRWTIPIGGGFGKVFQLGRQPVNTSLQGFYNLERPSGAPDWQIRLQFSLLFPK